MKILIIVLSIFFVGCSSSCPVAPKGNVEFENINLGVCLSSSLINQEYIISNSVDYEKLKTTNNCTSNLPLIDFTKKILLGKFTSGQCEMTVVKSLISNEVNKTLTYHLTVCSKGLCKSKAVNMNWILVDKVNSGVNILFEIEQK